MGCLLCILALAALTQAAQHTTIDVTLPPPTGLRPRAPQLFVPGDDSTLKCTASTFANKTTEFSATTEDCLCIADNLSTEDWSGSFLLRPADGVGFGATAVTCRSCSFVVETKAEGGTSVGSEDVAGYVRDAVERFVKLDMDRIGAEGETVCEDGVEVGGFVNMKWSIAHVPN